MRLARNYELTTGELEYLEFFVSDYEYGEFNRIICEIFVRRGIIKRTDNGEDALYEITFKGLWIYFLHKMNHGRGPDMRLYGEA